VSALFLASAASGCAVGPDFMPPEASVQDNWIEKSDMRVSNKDVKADWWRVFNDPTLDRLIHLGADENLPVQIAVLPILGARAQLGVAIGELFPQQQEAAGAETWNKISERAANNANLPKHAFADHALGFDATWEIDFWGRFRRNIEAADASMSATMADYDNALVSLTGDIANPLDPETMIGAQASSEQLEKILSYIDIGKQEGAKVLAGGERNTLEGDLAGGFYVKPTVLAGHNRMRVFQEEIFGPVVSVTTFKDDEAALHIANDTLYGLGAGVWSRDVNRCYRFGRAIQAGRVWANCYHAYPAHAAFGGYKQSGIGRENHKMMLDQYQQTKNMLVSYSPKKLGFF
jgi:hypothetical protein